MKVMTWLGLTEKLSQGEISTPLTTPIPTMSHPKLRITLNPTPDHKFKITLSPRLMMILRHILKLTIYITKIHIRNSIFRPYLRPTMIPTLRPALKNSLRPTEYFTRIPLLWITADDAKDEDEFVASVSVFEDWYILGYLYSDNKKSEPICI